MTSGANSGTLGYDPLMRFYQSGTTYYVHDSAGAGQLLGEYYNGNISGRYVPGAGMDEPLVAVTKTGARSWYHADERGSVIAGSNNSGVNERIVTYDENGKRGGNLSYRFAFTGQVHLINDVYDYKSRHYNARLPRFLQTDTIGLGGGMNPYVYAGGDPVNFSDPLGLTPDKLEENPIVITAIKPESPPLPPMRAGTWGAINPGSGGNPEPGEDRGQDRPTCDTPGADQFNCDPVVNGSPEPRSEPQLQFALNDIPQPRRIEVFRGRNGEKIYCWSNGQSLRSFRGRTCVDHDGTFNTLPPCKTCHESTPPDERSWLDRFLGRTYPPHDPFGKFPSDRRSRASGVR